MLSRPAIPLVDLLYASHGGNRRNTDQRRYETAPDSNRDNNIGQSSTSEAIKSSSPCPSPKDTEPTFISARPQIDPIQNNTRSESQSSVDSSTSLSSPKLLVVNHTGKISKERTRPHPAPIISPEANPRVRTVWDEDWPHHRATATNEAANPRIRSTEPLVRDWAYITPNRTPSRNSLRGTVHSLPQDNATLLSTIPDPAISSNIASDNLRANNQWLTTSPNPPANTSRSTENLAIHPPRVDRLGSMRRNSLSREPLVASEDSVLPMQAPADTNSSTRGIYNPSLDRPRDERAPQQWGSDKYDENDFIADDLKRTGTITLKEGQHFSFHLFHRPQPIARNWTVLRKRFVATVTCLNTALIGTLIGIYAGEVPAIQYTLADQHHHVILGNVVLYIAMGLVVFIFWPLPLLHGRRPYTLGALAVALPLQIPQAVVVDQPRGTNYTQYVFGLLFARALSGLSLGFMHINLISTLLDLFGASLQSENPHGEIFLTSDVRRHGGGMGLWLGAWCWCFIGSLSLGFLIGAEIISGLNVSWGFYIGVIFIACALLLNVVTPETRRAPHRKTMQEVRVGTSATAHRVALGEIKMHVYGEGPKWWWEEMWAGIHLSIRMLLHTGFLVIAFYVGWIYAEVVLVIVLLGNLLSAEYRWRPEYVGLGVFSVAVGALLAVPMSKANLFSRSRSRPPRTDSMTFQPRITWTSHLVRRVSFMITLPLAGLSYTLASRGKSVQFMVPIVFAGVIGYISNLAIAECNGIIMETFDTSDLQPGSNSRHRLQSLPMSEKHRRTAYSSYPRVSAALFVSQSLGFLLAAAATGIGGAVTRKVGAQKATAITAGILLGLTLLLTAVLWRYKDVQVIPNELFGHYFGSGSTSGPFARGAAVTATAEENQPQRRTSTASIQSDRSWRAVVIGSPSGRLRRMNWLELGSLSRWTEIRRLNRLLNRSTTQGLNPGWR